MATLSEVARLLGVDRDTVKGWAMKYAEHLSPAANPAAGVERRFDQSDLRVLALVAEETDIDPSDLDRADARDEDDPTDERYDFDPIHGLINEGIHVERHLEWSRLNSPLFTDVPEEADETWRHGVMLGGMAERNLPGVAKAYKVAADELLETALKNYEPHELDYPVLFLYRHAVEVYLKAMLHDPPRTHDLGRLIELLERQAGGKVAEWVRERLRDFQRIDAMSDCFRYDGGPADGELWVDFHHLRAVMDRLCEAFEKFLQRRDRG